MASSGHEANGHRGDAIGEALIAPKVETDGI